MRSKSKSRGSKKCPSGVWCADTTTIGLLGLLISVIIAAVVFVSNRFTVTDESRTIVSGVMPGLSIFEAPPFGFSPGIQLNQQVKPDLYPEPVVRIRAPPSIRTRVTPVAPIQQVGILTVEGGSSGSASPDRTILPLYGREIDPRRSKWTYYTRTDGTNPVQVPVRVGNRNCDDDRNGCKEIFNDDNVHVPALGRAFTATIYNKSF
jgi:Family of unknown function (DUF5755)